MECGIFLFIMLLLLIVTLSVVDSLLDGKLPSIKGIPLLRGLPWRREIARKQFTCLDVRAFDTVLEYLKSPHVQLPLDAPEIFSSGNWWQVVAVERMQRVIEILLPVSSHETIMGRIIIDVPNNLVTIDWIPGQHGNRTAAENALKFTADHIFGVVKRGVLKYRLFGPRIYRHALRSDFTNELRELVNKRLKVSGWQIEYESESAMELAMDYSAGGEPQQVVFSCQLSSKGEIRYLWTQKGSNVQSAEQLVNSAVARINSHFIDADGWLGSQFILPDGTVSLLVPLIRSFGYSQSCTVEIEQDDLVPGGIHVEFRFSQAPGDAVAMRITRSVRSNHFTINYLGVGLNSTAAGEFTYKLICALRAAFSSAKSDAPLNSRSKVIDGTRFVPCPAPQDYNEAIQAPAANLRDAELRSASLVVNSVGMPRVVSGAFASVYQLTAGNNKRWAVRCFLTALRDQEHRYKELSRFVSSDDLSCTVGFEYQAQGIRVGTGWHPVIKMDWVEGQQLDAYIRENLQESKNLSDLRKKFAQMLQDMQRAGIAHGDLQHGNIIVRDGELVLVDYDCMYVPALAGLPSNELGHRNYQHPGRDKCDFGPEMDNFSAWIIDTSLLAVELDPSLWQTASGGDECLLFRSIDFEKPYESKIFQRLLGHPLEVLRERATALISFLSVAPRDVPPLSDEVVVMSLQSLSLQLSDD